MSQLQLFAWRATDARNWSVWHILPVDSHEALCGTRVPRYLVGSARHALDGWARLSLIQGACKSCRACLLVGHAVVP